MAYGDKLKVVWMVLIDLLKSKWYWIGVIIGLVVGSILFRLLIKGG